MRVWVVTETNRKTGHTTIYGAFASEALAREDYGDDDDTYEASFDWLDVIT